MTDARDEVISQISMWSVGGPHLGPDDAGDIYDSVIESLNSAGFRILGPDEIDGPTVEKCAEVADEYATRKDILHSSIHFHVCANRLRALKEKRT